MKKIIIILTVLVLIAVVALAMTREESRVVEQGGAAAEDANSDVGGGPATDRDVRGTIVSVNNDQVPADGPSLIGILQDDGSQAVIAVRSMGINLCPAQANIVNPFDLKAGDRVEARGTVGEEGMILPCESAGHYLRIVQ